MEYKKRYIFGASGHGKVVSELIINSNTKVDAFLDDQPKESYLNDIPVLNASEIENSSANTSLIIAVGNNKNREEISLRYQNFSFYNSIHKTAFVSPSANLGFGTVVMLYAIINAGAKIGNHVIINTAAIIEHDCHIDDFVHISPNVVLSGNINVGTGSHLGTGVIVIPGVNIGKWCTIGAGTVVIKDVPDGATVVGNPGKIIRYANDIEISANHKKAWKKNKVIALNSEIETLQKKNIL